MRKCFYYDEVGIRSSALLDKEFGSDKATSTITIKTLSPRPLPYAIPRLPLKLSGSYAATISSRDGSVGHQLTATAKLWDRLTSTTTLSAPKGKFSLASALVAEDFPFPGLTLSCAPAPWDAAQLGAKYHSRGLGVFSALKKDSSGKPVSANTLLAQLPRNLYLGLGVDLSLLKVRSSLRGGDVSGDVSDDDDDDDGSDVEGGDEEENDDDDDVIAEEKESVSAKKGVVARLAGVRKSVSKFDAIFGYVSAKTEVKGYISNFGKVVGCAIFRQISDAWSVAVNARCDAGKRKKKGEAAKGLFVEGAAKYVAESGSVVKVKCNSECVVKGSYAVKFSEGLNALFYGSVNKELKNNVGFSLVFNK